ncbi:MAG: hypothetical protein ACK4NS_12970 [Saprospiraceae bacterium]
MNKQQQHIESFIRQHREDLDIDAPPARVWRRIDAALSRRPSDALERLVSAQRDALDVHTPSPALWPRIARALPTDRPALRVGRALRQVAAAAALLLIGLTGGIFFQKTQQADHTPPKPVARAMSMSELSPQYARLESDYIRQISEKRAQLRQLAGRQAVEVQNDLRQMELIMAELQQELALVPPANREQVVRVMIETYEAKAAILTRVLERLPPLARDSTPPTPDSRL